MGRSRSFKDLIVWQKSHQLVLDIYNLSAELPKNERFGITSQITRCSVSVPTNISESFGRAGLKDKIRFLNIANGSLEETRYFLILIQDLGLAETNNLFKNAEEVSMILNAYIKTMKSKL